MVKALIISDELYIHERVGTILNNKNIEFEIADNVKIAKEWLITKNYDIVITDSLIWGLTSLEVNKILKDKKINTCVIVMADLATLELAEKTVKEGAFVYIIKPQDIERISSYVELYLFTRHS